MTRRSRNLWLLLSALALAGVPALADDDLAWGFEARLGGFQEAPPVSTMGRGEFQARLVKTANGPALAFQLRYGDLEGGAVGAAHVHFGQRGVNGGVSAFLCGGGGKPACPDSGTTTGVIAPEDVLGPTGQGIRAGELRELLRAMRGGVAYVNVHTETFRDGEIRGQIEARD